MRLNKEKVEGGHLTLIIAFAVLAVITLVAIVFDSQIFGEDSIFNDNISSNGALNTIYQSIPALFTTCEAIFLASILYVVIKHVLLWALCRNRSGETAARLFVSFVKYLIAIIALLTILSSWGVDTTTLVASAGIVSLIVGLGAQSLIADIIAGMFIVFEQEYKVGDIIVIDGWRGTVLEIGIRSTKIIDAGGNIKIVNNSSVSSIVNQTDSLSLAKATIGIDYAESLAHVEVIISENIQRMKDNVPGIVEGPFYKGVNELADSSVNLLFFAKCREEDIYDVQRGLNRELKLIFDENNISIPFPQVVINRPANIEGFATKHEEREAQEFVEQQRDESKGLDEENN